MHGGPLHAAFNVYWLMVFGPALENRLGSWRMLGLVVLLIYETLERGDAVYPAWYLPLRVRLTALVIVTLSAWLLIPL